MWAIRFDSIQVIFSPDSEHLSESDSKPILFYPNWVGPSQPSFLVSSPASKNNLPNSKDSAELAPNLACFSPLQKKKTRKF